ncbi:MAG TPA: 3D domain-containing protein [Pseudoneobacillus sp.]|nr:3D domain-containing protein [Pseudoneobacillus sp.]
MGRGTQVVMGISILTNLVLGGYVYSHATQVPKLEQKVQDLEQLNSALYTQNDSYSKLADKQAEEIAKLKDEVKKPQPPSRGSDVIRRMDNFQVTWYNDNGITKSGKHTDDGITIAVDPRVIPLGTWVRIVFEDGTTMVRRADDTGRAVKGQIIDIYKDASEKTLRNLGRSHNVTVYILDKRD